MAGQSRAVRSSQPWYGWYYSAGISNDDGRLGAPAPGRELLQDQRAATVRARPTRPAPGGRRATFRSTCAWSKRNSRSSRQRVRRDSFVAAVWGFGSPPRPSGCAARARRTAAARARVASGPGVGPRRTLCSGGPGERVRERSAPARRSRLEPRCLRPPHQLLQALPDRRVLCAAAAARRQQVGARAPAPRHQEVQQQLQPPPRRCRVGGWIRVERHHMHTRPKARLQRVRVSAHESTQLRQRGSAPIPAAQPATIIASPFNAAEISATLAGSGREAAH